MTDSSEADPIGRRKSPRALFRSEAVFGHRGRSCPVSVLDLSRHGLRLRVVHKFSVGDEFWISLPGLRAQAVKVSWVRDFVMGCAFREPLHPAIFDAIVNGHTLTETKAQRYAPEPKRQRFAL